VTIISIEVVRLNANYRVVSMHDGPRAEWVLQRFTENQWCHRASARLRSSLFNIIKRWAGPIDPVAREILDSLPTHLGEW
jgi:hypothetical protein